MLNPYKTSAMKEFNKKQANNPNFENNQIHPNKHICVVGPTGSGKTSFLVNYIQQMFNVFGHVYIYTKMPDEPIYEMLKARLKDQITIENIRKVKSAQELNTERPVDEKLVVFDDFITESKKLIYPILEQYAIVSRKLKCTCLYLSQSYHAIPKVIRLQSRYLVLLSLANKKDLSLIVSNINVDLEANIIKQIITNATEEDLNVCIVDLETKAQDKIFRRNFKDWYIISNNTIELFTGTGIIN